MFHKKKLLFGRCMLILISFTRSILILIDLREINLKQFFFFRFFLGVVAVYFAAIAHGLTYVAAFSYVNLRVSNRRSLRLAAGHIWYFLGCGLASQVVNLKFIGDMADKHDLFYKQIGTLMSVSSGILLLMLTINESLHFTKIYNYKCSLDDEINKANNVHSLYLTRDEVVTALQTVPVSGYKLQITQNYDRSTVFWMLLLKLKGFALFSSVMIYFAGTASMIQNGNKSFYLIQWMVFIGCVISVPAYAFYSTKILFYLFSTSQVLGLIAATIVYSDSESLVDAAIPLWMYYAFLGAGYCIADIALLDVAPLKSTESFLAVAYFIEILPVAIVQYCLFYQIEAIILHDNIITFRVHSIALIFLLAVLMIVISLNMPNTYGKSLFQIRNELFGINYVRQNIVFSTAHQRLRRITKQNQYVEQGLYTISGNRNYSLELNGRFHQTNRNYTVPTVFLGGAVVGSVNV